MNGMAAFGFLLVLLFFALVGVGLWRWIFRINVIVDHLSNIVDCLCDVVDILEERPKRQKPKDKATRSRVKKENEEPMT